MDAAHRKLGDIHSQIIGNSMEVQEIQGEINELTTLLEGVSAADLKQFINSDLQFVIERIGGHQLDDLQTELFKLMKGKAEAEAQPIFTQAAAAGNDPEQFEGFGGDGAQHYELQADKQPESQLLYAPDGGAGEPQYEARRSDQEAQALYAPDGAEGGFGFGGANEDGQPTVDQSLLKDIITTRFTRLYSKTGHDTNPSTLEFEFTGGNIIVRNTETQDFIEIVPQIGGSHMHVQ